MAARSGSGYSVDVFLPPPPHGGKCLIRPGCDVSHGRGRLSGKQSTRSLAPRAGHLLRQTNLPPLTEGALCPAR